MSGKESLTRLAAFVMECNYVSLSYNTKSGKKAFHHDIQQILLRTVLKDEKLCVDISSEILVNSDAFTELQDLLLLREESTSFLTDFFGSDGAESVYNALKRDLESKEVQGSQKASFALFLARITKNLRIIFTFLDQETFHLSIARYPVILKEVNVFMFQEWDIISLQTVADQLIRDSVIDYEKKQSISRFLAFAYESAANLVQEMKLVGLNCQCYFKTFLISISTYNRILGSESASAKDQLLRFDLGLGKLNSILDDISTLEKTLDHKAKEIEEKKILADQLVDSISKDQSSVLEEVENLQAEVSRCDELEFRCALQQQDCTRVLTEAEPSIFAAEMALNTIDKKDIIELKSLLKPPLGVEDVTAAILALKGEPVKSRDWNSAKYLMRDPATFILELKGFKQAIDDGKMTPSYVDAARQYLNLEHFNSSIMIQRSKAVAGLCDFVINIISYYDIVASIEPKRRAVALANEELLAATARKTDLSEIIRHRRARIAELEEEYTAVLEAKNVAIRDAEKVHKQLTLAQRLSAALTNEKISWGDSLDKLKTKEQKLVYGSLVPATFISYAGSFSSNFRNRFIHDHLAVLLKRILHPPSMSIVADPVEMISEPAQKYPNFSQMWSRDQTFLENELILRYTERYPLIIDPHLVGLHLLQTHSKVSNLKVDLVTSPTLKSSLANAVQFGWSILIEGIDGDLEDKELWNLISKRYFKKESSIIYYIGEKECEPHESFRLYLHSKHGSPQYPSRMQGECTIINFALSEAGFENRFLEFILKNEQPSATAKRAEALRNHKNLLSKKQEIDDAVLQRLSEAPTSIINDLHQIQFFENSRRMSSDVINSIEDVTKTINMIVTSLDIYRKAAQRVTLIFLLLSEMHMISSYYRFSLDSFMDVLWNSFFSKQSRFITVHMHVPALMKAAAKSPFQRFRIAAMTFKASIKCELIIGSGKRDQALRSDFERVLETGGPPNSAESKIQEFMNALVKQVYDLCCVSLHERHRLVFSSMLMFRILYSEQRITSIELGKLVSEQCLNASSIPHVLLPFISETAWASILNLQGIPTLSTLAAEIESNADRWNIWYNSMFSESLDMPGRFKTLSRCQKLLVLRALRPDRVIPFIKDWISEELGPWFLGNRPYRTSALLQKCGPSKPAIFITSSGTDISLQVQKLFAARKGLSSAVLSELCIGTGSDVQIVQAIYKAVQSDSWILVRDIHLSRANTFPALKYIVNESSPKHPGFLCIFTADIDHAPAPAFPSYIIEYCLKISSNPPVGLRAILICEWRDLEDSYGEINRSASLALQFAGAKLFAVLCFFHAYLAATNDFFNWRSGTSCRSSRFSMKSLLLNVKPAFPLLAFLRNSNQSFMSLKQIFENIYVGHSIDKWETRKYLELLWQLLGGSFKEAGFPAMRDLLSKCSPASFLKFEQVVQSLYSDDSAGVLGIAPNAEAQAFLAEGKKLFNCLNKTSFSYADSISRVRDVLSDLMNQLPGNLSTSEIREKLFGATPPWDRDRHTPLAYVLMYECERMNDFLSKLRISMQFLRENLDAGNLLEENMKGILNDLEASVVPRMWLTLDFPSSEDLGSWFVQLLARVSKLIHICDCGVSSTSIWISGLFSPALLLTAVIQMQSRNMKIPLEQFSVQCSVTGQEWDMNVVSRSEEQFEGGCCVHGMFIDGARWDSIGACLSDQRPKEYYPKLPMIHIRGILNSDSVSAAADEKNKLKSSTYECPVYRTVKKHSIPLLAFNLEAGGNLEKVVLSSTCLLLST